ncbi:MAG: hypothetical protein DI535_27350 [Citrobacter freundii]|nr:MAG: hypothetical protein DI535_27350 [Citrobacter freundii]
MIMKRCLLACLITAGMTYTSHAQLHIRSLKDILAYADSNAVSITSSLIQQQIAASKTKEASAFLYPSVNASAGFNDNLTLQPTLVPEQLFNPSAPADSYKEMKFGRQYIYSAGIQAQWNILDFQRIFARQTAALQETVEKSNTAINRFNTYNQLASSYYSIQLTKYMLEVCEKNLAATREMLASAEDKYARGVIGEQERNLVAIEHLRNENNLQQATGNLDQYLRQLQSQLNVQDEIIVDKEDGRVNVTDASADIGQWPLHPEVDRQEIALGMARASLKETRAAHYPSLSAVYQYNYNWATSSFMDLSGANQLPQQYLGLKLSVPIFNGLATRQRTKQAGLYYKIQEEQLNGIKLAKEKEDEILLIQYQQSLKAVQKNKDILALQEKNDFHSANQYKTGLISLDVRIDRYKDLLSAQDLYLQSLAGYTLSQYKFYIRQLNFSTDAQ